MKMTEIRAEDYDMIRRIMQKHTGNFLDADKDYFIGSRLGDAVKLAGYEKIDAFLARLRKSPEGREASILVQSLLITETHFFRDGKPFDVLREHVLPELMDKNRTRRELSIWSCGCSGGQEAYSVAMLLHEIIPDVSHWHINILATDMNAALLERAREGIYSEMEVRRGLSEGQIDKYFNRSEDGAFEIDYKLRRMVSFMELNLIGTWPPLDMVDIIFLRNVLIYFTVEDKQRILHRAHQLLHPGGYLFMGGAETTLQVDEHFERMPWPQAGCYRLMDG